jgi:hypothetical protein
MEWKESTMRLRIAWNIVTDSLLFRHSDPDGMERVDDALKYCVEYCDGFAIFPSLGSGWDGKSRRCS